MAQRRSRLDGRRPVSADQVQRLTAETLMAHLSTGAARPALGAGGALNARPLVSRSHGKPSVGRGVQGGRPEAPST
jgi:hypothetical protein